MAITYSAGTGTLVTTFAMNETLGAQTQQTGNSTVVVSDTLAVLNNGQIGTKYTTYVNRLVVINLGTASEQRRMCTGQTAGTGTTVILTVHEDWTVNPAQNDTIHVCYDVDDIETGSASGGIGLSAKTGLYELSNLLTVQTDGGLQNSFGQALELKDRGTSTAFIIQGRFYSGYEANGQPVNGGIFTSYNNGAGEPSWQFQSGSEAYLYDSVFWSQLLSQDFECAAGSTARFYGSKFLSNTQEGRFYGSKIYNCGFSGRSGASEIIRIDTNTTIDGLILSKVNYLDTVADTTSESITIKGVVFSGITGLINMRDNKTWHVIDPVWSATTYTDFTWTGSTSNYIYDERSVTTTTKSPDGTLLQNALVNVYEGSTNNLVTKLVTDANGYAGGVFVYKLHATNSSTTTYNNHAIRVDKWLYQPFITSQSSVENFDSDVTLIADSNIVQTTQATALSDGSGITWNEDTNPSEIFEFTSGSGTAAVGMIITFTSGAIGTITQILDGDSTAGTIHLNTRNSTAITNGDTFSRTGGTAGTFSGTYTNSTAQKFSIYVDGISNSYQIVYDYLAALTSETTLTATGELIHEWGQDEQGRALYLGNDGFYTERSNGKGVIVVNSGGAMVEYFTDDAGGTWTPPVSYTHTLIGLEQNSEVTYVLTSDGTTVVFHVEDVSVSDGAGKYKTTYTHFGGESVDILIHHLDYQPDISCVYGITLPSSDATIKITQFADLNTTWA